MPFSGKFGSKNTKLSVSVKIVRLYQLKLKFVRLTGVCRIHWCCSHFLFVTRKPFSKNLFQKIKTIILSRKLVPRLI